MKNAKLPVLMVAAFGGVFAGDSLASDFQHGVTSPVKPWTDRCFPDARQEFRFAIVADRTGDERKGAFEKAIDSLNRLRPDFVMSVGDLVDGRGVSEPVLRKQWDEVEEVISRLEVPFFHVVGNHDVWTGFTGMTPARKTSIELWKELHGTNTYYSFTYKRCLFVCLDSMERHDYFPPREPLPQHQLDWAASEIERQREVRWTFIFMHKPLDWTSDRWLAFERRINKYDYTVFCGDWHNHCTAVRHGKRYYMIGTTGGGFDYGLKADDLRYGCMDSITWVSVRADDEPVVSNLALSGLYGDTIQTSATTQGWIETPLDYPSHLSEPTETYRDETNTALIPTEVMDGPGYDWHFRHAVILRQGCVYGSGLEPFEKGKRRVVLLGDESASERASEYGAEWQVFDFGFKGDRIENVLWRVQQGELKGYEPAVVVVSVGGHNKNANTEGEIAAAMRKLVTLVRRAAPGAEIRQP